MGISSKAWEGIDFVIFGRSPTLPMKLEQTIAQNAPNLETKIESFEFYEDALDHCKNKKNIGFFLLLEDSLTPGIDQIFKNLASPFSQSGWTAYAGLVHMGIKSILGQSYLISNRNFIDYVGFSEFESPNECQKTLNHLWHGFLSRLENDHLPQALQDTLIAIASKEASFESIHFYDRALTMLSDNLTLSWKETFALRWKLVLSLVEKHNSLVLSPHKILKSFSDLITPPNEGKFKIEVLSDKNLNLGSRLFILLLELCKNHEEGTLINFLTSVCEKAKPGSPAIFRQVARNKDRLLAVAKEGKVAS